MMIKKTITSIFTNFGIKVVSKTDKSKGAYVLNNEQVKVLEAAGKKPGDSFEVNILGDKNNIFIKATYYHSERKGSGRSVEPRMGTEIISRWLNRGDELFIANDGGEIFAIKLNDNSFLVSPPEVVKSRIISGLPTELIKRRAKSAPRKARKTTQTSESYVRNPYIIEAAKRRAGGICEMPDCTYKAFIAENGLPYLEGHHVKPLSEGGDDATDNVAALCPICHREQHFSKDKADKRNILREELDKIIKKS